MTTILVAVFLKRKKFPNYIIIIFVTIYGLIEIGFLVANMAKFLHGGWFTLLLASFLLSIMWAWFSARKIKNRFVKFVEVDSYYPILKELSEDESVPKYASQLVYLTSSNFNSEIESKIMYSILQKQPKRADVYWLVHVDVTDEPFTRDYKVEFLVPNKLIRIDFKLGFRVEQQINVLFRKVVEELVRNNEVDITSKYTSLNKYKIIGDFRFVVLERFLSYENELPFWEGLVMRAYFFVKQYTPSEDKWFGLDSSAVKVEKVPFIIKTTENINLKRIPWATNGNH